MNPVNNNQVTHDKLLPLAHVKRAVFLSTITNGNKCFFAKIAMAAVFTLAVSGCSMTEELKRIEWQRKAKAAAEQVCSGNLAGEQIFIRNCNTCHPGLNKCIGPSLEHLSEHFKTDQALVVLIRSGKGLMPAQSVVGVSELEMKGLVDYLRHISAQH